jgi:hypothetical protein
MKVSDITIIKLCQKWLLPKRLFASERRLMCGVSAVEKQKQSPLAGCGFAGYGVKQRGDDALAEKRRHRFGPDRF